MPYLAPYVEDVFCVPCLGGSVIGFYSPVSKGLVFGGMIPYPLLYSSFP